MTDIEEYENDFEEDFLEDGPKKNKGKKIIIDLGKEDEEENLILYSEEKYTPSELDEMATEILRAHARTIDIETGKARGIAGEDPILFEEHLYSRKRREIYNQNGVPDPSINEGMFWRTHPQGRKVNSDDQRKRHGASFYR